tara:strand:- start:401 stop:919 length:519 start_codon:yes stop_codon:yes gene_type:complete
MNKLLEVYSKGLFNSLTNEQVGDIVQLFQNITLSDPKKELGEMFKNRTIKKDDKIAAALELVGDDANLQAFIKTLATNGRLDLIPEVFGFFVDYASRRQNNVPVKVTVNEEPSEDVKQRVSSFVATNISGSTPIKYEINKSMMGGVVLKYKDNEIDLSVDNKLNGLNSVLIN